MTVGTGNNPDSEDGGFRLLARKLYSTITKIYPDHVVFFASDESRLTVSYIEELFKEDGDEFIVDEDYRIVKLESIDDFNECFEIFEWTIWDFDFKDADDYNIIMDYTSGTKTMSAAMACCGLFYSKDLVSVIGDRSTGEVSPGTEHINFQNPYRIYDKFSIMRTRYNFNANRFMSCIDTLNCIIDTSDIHVDSFLSLCEAYLAWDHMDFEAAYGHMKNVDRNLMGFAEIRTELEQNLKALGIIMNSKSANLKNCYILASLINNSIRKAEEYNYDDAIARLYRAFELIAQIRLTTYNIRSSNVDVSLLLEKGVSKDFIDELEKERYDGKIRIGLLMDYLLLNELDDDLGRYFIENEKKIMNTTLKRNNSILAHGLESKSKEDFDEFLEVVIDMARRLDRGMNRFIKETKFAKFDIKLKINRL